MTKISKCCLAILKLVPLLVFLAASMASPTIAAQPGAPLGNSSNPAEFKISDIRIEGLQRISAGLVFSPLPVSVGDTVGTADLQNLIKTLFRTGNFENISVAREGNILVVIVEERPSISEINIEGNKAIETEALLDGLKSSGLSEGKVFKRSTLEGIRLELQRQYVAQGRYDSEIEAEVVEQPRNRVDVNININEGSVAKIKHINIVGNKVFSTEELLELFEQGSTGFWSFFSGNDKYSKERLKGDLENLESFYLDQGYIKFNIDSTQVAISPTRDAVFITANIVEGDIHTIKKVELSGDIIIEEDKMKRLLLVRKGQNFSQRLITSTEELITRRLGNEGYTFAKVTGIPEINDEDNTVNIKFFVDPGKRTYVRRINFIGNTKTVDEVLRREMRQMEGAPAASHKIEYSRVRLERLGYFKGTQVETPEVPGSNDLIDVNYSVEEQFSGSIGASVGYASGSGLLLGANLQQSNFMGSGKQIGVGVNTSKYQTVYRFSYMNPYYTKDGVSRGFSVFYRETDLDEVNISRYSTNTYGVNMTFGYPLSEIERLGFTLGASHTEITTGAFAVQEIARTPQRLYSDVDDWAFGDPEEDYRQILRQPEWDPNDPLNPDNETITECRITDEDGDLVIEDGEFVYVPAENGLPPENAYDCLFETESFDVDDLEEEDYLKSPEGFLDKNGDTFDNYSFAITWSQSQLNRGRLATAGSSQSISLEVTLPGSDLEFYKAIYKGQYFVPVARQFSLRFHTELGYGDSYGDSEGLPFFENFFAGGFGSVRGYERNTLGPRSTSPESYRTDGLTERRTVTDLENQELTGLTDAAYIRGKDGSFETDRLDSSPDPFGGNISIEGGIELIFPLPFVKDQRSVRSVLFVDAGNVFSDDCGEEQKACYDVDLGELRYSVGIGLTWITAMGPLTFSLAKPFDYGDFDERKHFDFSLGFGY